MILAGYITTAMTLDIGCVTERSCEIGIIVVNFRTPNLVTQCMDSLLPELDGLAAEVAIVDNASGDDSIAKLESWLSAKPGTHRIRIIRAERNCGFASGNNLGIRSLQAQHYLLLNSDTLLKPGAVCTLLDDMRRFKDVGLVSPRLQWADGSAQKSCFRNHTPASEFLAAARTGPISALLPDRTVALSIPDSMIEPEWTSFAAVLIRGDVFKTVGLLDEGFFMYFEDAEFCNRATKAGWKILHDPAARVIHLRGGTSPVKKHASQRKRLPRYFYASRSRYFFLSYGWLGLTATNVSWWLGRSISLARELFGRKKPHVCEHQWQDIWTNWLKPGRSFGCL